MTTPNKVFEGFLNLSEEGSDMLNRFLENEDQWMEHREISRPLVAVLGRFALDMLMGRMDREEYTEGIIVLIEAATHYGYEAGKREALSSLVLDRQTFSVN